MRKFIISFCCYVFFIFTLAAQDKAPHYTVIVSLDAFRWDYPAMYDTPNLNQMAREGVKATMLPSYPASTFPNHYTLATGLVPDHNGIINNTFWDVKRRRQYSMGDPATRNNPDYYLGEPDLDYGTKAGSEDRKRLLGWFGYCHQRRLSYLLPGICREASSYF